MERKNANTILRIVRIESGLNGDRYVWFMWIGNSVRMRSVKKFKTKKIAWRSAYRWTQRMNLKIGQTIYEDKA